jgi:hypothetical protein
MITHSEHYIHVTCRPISRQLQKYAQATIEKVLEEMFYLGSTPSPVLGNGPIDTHSNRCFICGPRHARCWLTDQ